MNIEGALVLIQLSGRGKGTRGSRKAVSLGEIAVLLI